MSQNRKQRNRGRILTDAGWKRIWEAIYLAFQDGHSFSAISKRTDPGENPQAVAYITSDTVAAILNLKRGVDEDSLRKLFVAFGLQLEASDHVSSSAISTADPDFVGRERALAHINSLVEKGAKAILILGEGGIGKTTLAWNYLKDFDLFIDYRMAKETQDVSSAEALVEDWLKRYFDEEPGREFGITLNRLQTKLAETNQRIGVLIDNLEPALKNGCFLEEHRRYMEMLRVLTHSSTRSLTLLTSREPLYEPGIQIYPLEALTPQAWQEILLHRQIAIGENPLDETSALSQIYHAYGGNAELLNIVISAVQTEAGGDLETYWQRNRDDLLLNPTLERYVQKQFDKLAADNPAAYSLLCRLGCYRYQDVPYVPEGGLLALLWDVPDTRTRNRLIRTLLDRSLVKVFEEEYYLHPVIREEAISRLRNSLDWEQANHEAAGFWTQSVSAIETVQHALTAFEAYYHLIEIHAYEEASEVIIKERDNRWVKAAALGVSFYRLGLLNLMISSIQFLTERIPLGCTLSRIYNILGDLYWITGNISEAISHHQNSRNVVIRYGRNNLAKILKEHSYLKRCYLASFLNIGLCKIDLWELDEALKLLRDLNFYESDDKNKCVPSIFDSWFCIAFLESHFGNKDEAIYFAEKSKNLTEEQSERNTEWGIANRWIFLGKTYKNLMDIDKSFEMYNSAFNYSKKSGYIQVEANSLVGLAEIYRINSSFEESIPLHLNSIRLLSKINALCDLAEAHHQMGLTYQAIGEAEQSHISFSEAIRLFEEIKAPKQIERVRQSMKID